jgi:hypothetical protein
MEFEIVLNHGSRLFDLVVLATFVACAAPLPLTFDGGQNSTLMDSDAFYEFP